MLMVLHNDLAFISNTFFYFLFIGQHIHDEAGSGFHTKLHTDVARPINHRTKTYVQTI